MRCLSLLLVSFLLVLSSNAQQDFSIQWQRTMGSANNDLYSNTVVGTARNVAVQTSDGGYAVIMLRPSNPATTCDRGSWTGEKLFLVKFNKFGVTEWEQCYGPVGNGYWQYVSAGGVVQTSDGGYLIVGSTSFTDGDFSTNKGGNDGFAIKVTATGVRQWARCYGGSTTDGFSSVIQDYDGNFVMVGQAASNDGDVSGNHWWGGSGKDAWMVKINPSGAIIWQTCVGDNWNDENFYAVRQSKDSGYIAVGNIHAKVAKNGTVAWQKTGGSFEMALDSKDNIYTLSDQYGPGYVSKTDSSGNRLWTRKLFNVTTPLNATCIQLRNDTSIFVAGTTFAAQHYFYGLHYNPSFYTAATDIFLARLDSAGRMQQMRCFGGFRSDEPVWLAPTSDKGFLMMARASSSDGDLLQNLGDYDYWMVKIGEYNTIQGKLFYDYNNNGLQDNGEDPFTDVLVTSEKTGSVNGWYSTNGRFEYTVDTGALVTKPQISAPYYTINPAQYTTNRTNYGNSDTMNFAVVPVPGITDLSVHLSAMRPQRPGFFNQMYLVLTNNGTTLNQNARVGIVPDRKITLLRHDSAGFSRSADTLFWQVNNLPPRQSKTITINMELPASTSLNDSLFHYIVATPYNGDYRDYDNRDTVRQPVVGSFDPNNKLDDLGGLLYNDRYKAGDKVLYTINFQNTGTDTAFTVAIRDTLAAQYDVRTVQMVGASHPYKLLVKGNTLQWTFENIKLVDSTRNEPKSHGYVMFRVTPKTGLAVNQVIANRASIYFDYNAPVLTATNNVKIVNRPLTRPAIDRLTTNYCRRSGVISGKLMNLPAAGSTYTTLVRLDNTTTLPVATDSTFSFDPGTLTPGTHTVNARYTQGSTVLQSDWIFTITAAATLDLSLSASATTVSNTSAPVTITGSNAGGGTGFTYLFARDRNFTNLIQAESAVNTLSIAPATLQPGANWIYARINAGSQCYNSSTNVDSIALVMSVSTGIVDPQAPGQEIRICPVPFNAQLTVQGLSPAKSYVLTLVNAQGAAVQTHSVRNRSSFRLATAGIAPGAYFLHVTRDGKPLGVLTVLKQ